MKYLTVISVLVPIFLNSCGPAPLIATGAAAGYVASQDRTAGRIVDDVTASTKLKAKLNDDRARRFTNLSAKVNEGRALLTGNVHNVEARRDAVKIAWETDGIKEVINEIKISDHVKSTVGNYAKDTYITTQVKAKFAVAKNLTSRNFSIDTHDRKVYIMGSADSQEELNRAISIAKSVDNVREVICHAKVKSPYEKHDHRHAE